MAKAQALDSLHSSCTASYLSFVLLLVQGKVFAKGFRSPSEILSLQHLREWDLDLEDLSDQPQVIENA